MVGEGGSVFSAMRRLSRGELEELMTRKGGTARSTFYNSFPAVYNAEISLSKYFLPICISEGRCRHWQAHHNRYFPVAGLFHILLSLPLPNPAHLQTNFTVVGRSKPFLLLLPSRRSLLRMWNHPFASRRPQGALDQPFEFVVGGAKFVLLGTRPLCHSPVRFCAPSFYGAVILLERRAPQKDRGRGMRC